MTQAVFIWNNLPRTRDSMTPLELFTRLKTPENGNVLRVKVWGCPVYVLDPKLQDGKRLPKWTKRSRCGMHLGHSEDHHSTVDKILNLRTGHVSNQCHCVYDELYTTCYGQVPDTAFDPAHWNELLRLGSEHAAATDASPALPAPRPENDSAATDDIKTLDKETKRDAQQRVADDLFQSFIDPTHITPPPPALPAVPEGDDTFWPHSTANDNGTSDNEGALASEGASASEGAPNEGLR